MQFTFPLMNEADAQTICAWQYEEPYAVYNMTADPEDVNVDEEMLDRRSPYYAVRNEHGELVGFFSFGTSAQPWSSDEPAIYAENRTVTIGLGMRPDTTGKGLGLTFVNAGLAFARQQFQPNAFRLYVLAFNERAIHVYEKAGFRHVRIMEIENMYGKRAFVEMEREA